MNTTKTTKMKVMKDSKNNYMSITSDSDFFQCDVQTPSNHVNIVIQSDGTIKVISYKGMKTNSFEVLTDSRVSVKNFTELRQEIADRKVAKGKEAKVNRSKEEVKI